MTEYTIEVKALDAEGRGVGHIPNEDGTPGKVVFVEGALPGERVICERVKNKKQWEIARTHTILKASPMRVQPRCPHFGVCGGCSMQHLDGATQVAIKQRVLEDNLAHIGHVRPQMMLRAIHGPFWEYRFRARLSVNYVPKKGGVLVGFREKQSRYVADMKQCYILPKVISDMLLPLRELIGSLSLFNQIPQIEVAIGYRNNLPVIALLLRIMAPLTTEDEDKLRLFADKHEIQWWLQSKGLDTIKLFYPQQATLGYSLDQFNIDMPFKPGDFTQVNPYINQVLVSRALRLLDVQPTETVADLFCGLGNFSLPLAREAAAVVGIEGNQTLTQRAQENARTNQLEHKTTFYARNLFEMTPDQWVSLGAFDKVLIDPPRDGAMAVCQTIAGLQDDQKAYRPKRIVYVSCNPSTLARDAGILVNEGNYKLVASGVVNMFAHTSHVESMAVFELKN